MTSVLYKGSTNLDSWSPDQLKMMYFGGDNRAQSSESLYNQKPQEPPVQVSSSNSASNAPTGGSSSFTSRFEYTDNVQPSEISSERVLNHVSPPMSTNFLADYGMDSGFTNKNSSRAAELYKQLLSKEVAKNKAEESKAEDAGLPA
ncbi:hypothetical protein BC332_34349 [Capsicum chinense]|nr:hypothetical protein BC332_34349 [Capsicum chinense]